MSDPIENNVSGDTPAVVDASYQTGKVTVGTTATLLVVVPAGYTGGVLLSPSATGVFIGGSNVTTSTGVPLGTGLVSVPGGKGDARALYAVVASAGPTVTYILAAD